MKIDKKYRFKENPKEEEFYTKFEKLYLDTSTDILSGIIFGWKNSQQSHPEIYLTYREQRICLNLIQWLGSQVGQGFLRECGFELKKTTKHENN